MFSSGNPARTLTGVLFLLFLFLSFPVVAQNPFLGGGKDGGGAVRPPSVAPSGRLSELQFRFSDRAAELLQHLREDPAPSLLAAFFAAAFLYGLIHGAGPGHRKTVVFSLFLGRRARWFEPAAAGFLSAGVHAGTSMVLILLFSLIAEDVSVGRSTNIAGVYFQGITFVALAVFALVLIILKWLPGRREHRHAAGAGRGLYSMLVVSSLIPCPGATLLLLFSLSVGLPLLGIAGVISMSLGMGLIISVAGYLAYAGREGLFYRLKGRERTIRALTDGLETASYLFIFGLSLYMAWPFVTGLVS